MNPPAPTKDPFSYLESLRSRAADQWVSEQNARTQQALGDSPAVAALTRRLIAIYDSTDRIATCSRHGDWGYNTWTDAQHPLGLVRRTPWQAWLDGEPRWQSVLDVDALALNRANADGTRWTLADFDLRHPDGERALVSLAPDGSDACAIHEFDITTRAFLPQGFTLAEPGQHSMAWIDDDSVYVAWDDSAHNPQAELTVAGHPRYTRYWRRGQPLADAPIVLTCPPEAISAHAWFDHDACRHLAVIYLGMWRAQWLWRDAPDAPWQRYDIPDDAEICEWRQWLFITLRTDWQIAGQTLAAGSLVAIGRDAFLSGARAFTVLFTPQARRVLADLDFTRNQVIVTERHDCITQIKLWHPPGDASHAWRSASYPLPAQGSIVISAVDSLRDDTVLIDVDDFLTPPALYYADLSQPQPWQRLARLPPQFDSHGMRAELRHATAPDGESIPYWLIGRLDQGDPRPCLLYGYGGFEEALDEPAYLATAGVTWLERGGLYAIACTRGGGEFGPAWHQAALREKRQVAFDDFMAVAQDLNASGVTTPRQLAISGASNGGLLVAACMVQRPELFGAVLSAVPVLDMLRFHRLLQGATWVEEYGDPEDPQARRYLQAYSPYHNVQAEAAYPPVLFTTSSSDDRVHPGHARKMAARMQSLGHADVWYWERRDGGHGAGVEARGIAQAEALESEFLWRAVNR